MACPLRAGIGAGTGQVVGDGFAVLVNPELVTVNTVVGRRITGLRIRDTESLGWLCGSGFTTPCYGGNHGRYRYGLDEISAFHDLISY
ncbi:MAG: hypothetical protein ACYSUH_04565 [Planctomycetota bacterium]